MDNTNVVDLFERKARCKSPAVTQSEQFGMYFCTKCESDIFHINANGIVSCAKCFAMMSNITVQRR